MKLNIKIIAILCLILLATACSNKAADIDTTQVTQDAISSNIEIVDTQKNEITNSVQAETNIQAEPKNEKVVENVESKTQTPNTNQTTTVAPKETITSVQAVPKKTESTPTTQTQTEKKAEPVVTPEVEKTVSISVIGPDGDILPTQTIKISDEETVYSVLASTLKQNNIELKSSGSTNNKYVAGIGGYNEFDHGPKSGFTYQVDGVSPSYSSSKFELKGGENIVWTYDIN